MKRITYFLVLLFSLSALVLTAHAAGGAPSDDVKTNSVSVWGASKRDALRAANAAVETGKTPENVNYFADGTKFRTMDDGYYTITSTSDMAFNVDADGFNTDYEGVRITVWEMTDDITQRFRLVMGEDGSYAIYAACSHGGYSRAVGYCEWLGTLGLYSTDSPYFATFFIKDTGDRDGTKYLVLASDETKYLACDVNSWDGWNVYLCDGSDPETDLCKWKFETWGAEHMVLGEKAMYPGDTLLITQGPFDVFSHQEQNAIDMQVSGTQSIKAPFTGRVVAINEECGNVVWLESTSEVTYADGSYDYMTCLFMHDDDISDIYLDEIILQGQYFYEMGMAGYAEGPHVHISCFRGKYSPSMKINNDGDDAVDAWAAFWLPKGIPVSCDYGYVWTYDQ